MFACELTKADRQPARGGNGGKPRRVIVRHRRRPSLLRSGRERKIMWWWIIEAAAWVIFGASESGTWKRGRFRKHFGVEYDVVLGSDLQRFLSTAHVSDTWTWHTSIESADKKAKRFRVKYDDGYGQSGMIDVHVTGSSPSYQIEPEQIDDGNSVKPPGDERTP